MMILALTLALQSPVPALLAHREADCALQVGDLSSARAHFLRAEEFEPGLASIAYGLACVEAREGRPREAVEHLQAASDRGYRDEAVAVWDPDLATLRSESGFLQWRSSLRAENSAGGPFLPFVLKHSEASRLACLAIDTRGEFFATGSYDGSVVVGALEPRGRRRVIDCSDSGRVWNVAVETEGRVLAALWHSGELRLWKVPLDEGFTPEQCSKLTVFEKATKYQYPFGSMVSFSPRGDRLFAAGGGHGAILVDADGTLLHRIDPPGGHFFSVQATWNQDGSRLLLGRGRELLALRAEDGAEIQRWQTPASIESLAIDSSGSCLWIGSGEGEIGRIQFDSGEYERLTASSGDQFHFDEPKIGAIHAATESDRVAFSTASSAFVEVISDSCAPLWTSDFLGGRMGEPVDVLLSPQGRWLWYAWRSGAIRAALVDLSTGKAWSAPAWSFAPRSGGGKVAWICGDGFSVFDSGSGSELWQRIDLGEAEFAAVVKPGYFDYVGASFDQLTAIPSAGDRASDAGYKWDAPRYYDPKRVRAALGGVLLQPLNAD